MAGQERHARALLYLGALLILFGMSVVVWGTSSFTDHVPLVVKGKEPARSASFRCPAIFGEDGEPEASDDASEAIEDHSLTRSPCAPFRQSRRVLVVVDLAIVAAGLGLLLRLRARFAHATIPPATTSSST